MGGDRGQQMPGKEINRMLKEKEKGCVEEGEREIDQEDKKRDSFEKGVSLRENLPWQDLLGSSARAQ